MGSPAGALLRQIPDARGKLEPEPAEGDHGNGSLAGGRPMVGHSGEPATGRRWPRGRGMGKLRPRCQPAFCGSQLVHGRGRSTGRHSKHDDVPSGLYGTEPTRTNIQHDRHDPRTDGSGHHDDGPSQGSGLSARTVCRDFDDGRAELRRWPAHPHLNLSRQHRSGLLFADRRLPLRHLGR